MIKLARYWVSGFCAGVAARSFAPEAWEAVEKIKRQRAFARTEREIQCLPSHKTSAHGRSE